MLAASTARDRVETQEVLLGGFGYKDVGLIYERLGYEC